MAYADDGGQHNDDGPEAQGKESRAGQVDIAEIELRGLPDEETAGRGQHRGDEHSTVPLADGTLKAERAEPRYDAPSMKLRRVETRLTKARRRAVRPALQTDAHVTIPMSRFSCHDCHLTIFISRFSWRLLLLQSQIGHELRELGVVIGDHLAEFVSREISR